MSLAAYRPEQDWLQCFERNGNHYVCVWRISQKVLYFPSIEDTPVINTTIVNRDGTSSIIPSAQNTRTFTWDNEDWTRVLEYQDCYYRRDLPQDRYYVQYHRDAETHRSRETTWWAPEGPQIVLSNVVSNEFNQWLTQAASLSTDDITVVLRQTPSELSDDSTGLPPHSDRVRHMAYENERRVRRRLLNLEESPSVAMVSNPHHPPGGCNLE